MLDIDFSCRSRKELAVLKANEVAFKNFFRARNFQKSWDKAAVTYYRDNPTFQDENIHLLLTRLNKTKDFCLYIQIVGQTTLKYSIKESNKKLLSWKRKIKKKPKAQVLPEKTLGFF